MLTVVKTLTNRLWKNFKPLAGLGAVNLKVGAVKRDDLMQSGMFCRPDNGSVRDLHGPVNILSISNPGFATRLFLQIFFAINRKIRRAGKYAGKTSAARGIQGAGLERGGPLFALGR